MSNDDSGLIISTENVPLSFLAELKRRKVFRVALSYLFVAWIIIQVASIIFPSLFIPDWALRLVIMSLLLGFPVALLLAWAFELTPNGIKTTRKALALGALDESQNHEKKRKHFSLLGAAAIPALILGSLALFFYILSLTWQTVSIPVTEISELTEKSIAILPFENRSTLEDDLFFTDGIHDDLLIQISHIKAIRTISRTSVMTYRGTDKNLRTIGAELGVTAILEGGVQRAGNNIRINVQLIDVATDTHLWAETYTRVLSAENIFNIQSEISQTIAIALRAILSPQEQEEIKKLPTQNLAALEAFFMAKASIAKSSSEGYLEAENYLKQAISLDERFADAYISLAEVYLEQSFYSGLSVTQQADLARPLIETARELDGESSALANAEGALNEYLRNLTLAEVSYQKAIALNANNALAFMKYGHLLNWVLGNPLEAEGMFEKALALSPGDNSIKHQLAEALMAQGKYDQATKILEDITIQAPDYAMAWVNLGLIQLEHFQHFDEAIFAFHKAMAADPGNPSFYGRLGTAYSGLGDEEKSAYWFNQTKQEAPGSNMADFYQGNAFLDQNNVESALEAFYRVPVESDVLDGALINIAILELKGQQPEKAISHIKSLYPQLFESPPPVNIRNISIAVGLGLLLIETDEQQQGKNLLNKSLELGLEYMRRGNLSVTQDVIDLQLILGNEIDAFNTLNDYVNNGGSSSEFLQDDEYNDNPEVRRLRTIIAARVEEQRANLAQMVSNGDIPVTLLAN